MIFHTVCEQIYFNRFYDTFVNSIKNNSSNAKFSLHYVDSLNDNVIKYCDSNNILFSYENTSKDDLRKRFPKSDDGNIIGYYPLSRWSSIPENGENVCVCDVDLVAINTIDIDRLETLLETYDVVNITRLKTDGTTGGMMLMCLSSRIIPTINKFTKNIKDNITEIGLFEDVAVRTYIYSFNLYELHGKLLDVTKPKHAANGEWFVFSKGGQGENSIRKKNKIELFLNNK